MHWKIPLVLQAISINVNAKNNFFWLVNTPLCINKLHDKTIIMHFQGFANS